MPMNKKSVGNFDALIFGGLEDARFRQVPADRVAKSNETIGLLGSAVRVCGYKVFKELKDTSSDERNFRKK